ncbi:hypothetical protein ACFX15_002623 [Malus domestica]|uniref:F-box protein At2g26160-like n=1 Tax=Malus sylvestris TaxID=3752 RepID=UPI0010AB425A|nr:F-box protein At2g26160-like [Malus domestica]XP_050105831.1 F-box protein At2g26160-like [Malus sylvestris]
MAEHPSIREGEGEDGSKQSNGGSALCTTPLRHCRNWKLTAQSSLISWRIMPVSFSTTGWASLPALIFLILDKLPEPIDHVRFAAVCKDWRSLSKLYNLATNRWRHFLPMLLIPNENCPQADQRLVYSISEGRIYNHAQLQVPFSMRACGSSHGWLATVDRADTTVDCADQRLVIALRNPFRQASPVIRLPPIDVFIPKCVASYHEHFVRKVILSGDPSLNPDNYVVVAIYASDSRLAVFKAGQKSWHLIVKSFETADVIFYRGQVYAASMRGRVSLLDIDNPGAQPPELKLLTPKEPFERYSGNGYLVESAKGDLFHILRYCWMREVAPDKCFRFRTKGFLVYKWVFNDEEDGCIAHWVEVKSLGDEAVFLGDNHSVSVLASNFAGCCPNSIYYTDDFVSGCPLSDGDEPCDMGIFNLEDGTIVQHYSRHTNTPRAIWVVPRFNGLC